MPKVREVTVTDFLASFKDRNQEALQDRDALDRRLIELTALFEISQTINSSLNLKSILDNILLVPMGRMMVSKGIILLHKSGNCFSIETLKGLPYNLHDKEIEIKNVPTHPVQLTEKNSDVVWQDIFSEFKIELLVPFISRRKTLGLLGFGKKITGAAYTEREIEFLESLANIATSAIENALVFEEIQTVNRELDHKIQELNTLFEIGKELNLTLDRDLILKLLSYALMGQVTVNNFIIGLKLDGNYELAMSRGNLFKDQNDERCRELCERSSFVAAPYQNEDMTEFDDFLSELGIRAIIPMMIQNETGGYLFLGEKLNNQPYTAGDLEFLQTLANIAIISLENSRLFKETLEKQKLEEEMAMASAIQVGLLPKEMPDIAGLDIHGLNVPSKHVGGDYYDIIPVSDDLLALVIADVSGKGMPASLLMSNLQASLHSMIGVIDPLDVLVGKVNNVIYRNTSPEKYITFFVGVLNLKSLEMTFVNAGHNPPYLMHADKSIDELTNGGIILGMMPDYPFETGKVKLNKGDLLIMFTDGVTETMDEDEVEYEEKRLIDFITKYGAKNSSRELNERLLKELKDFSGDVPQGDDITILTLKVKQ